MKEMERERFDGKRGSETGKGRIDFANLIYSFSFFSRP